MPNHTLKLAAAVLVLVSFLALAITAEYGPTMLLLPAVALLYMPLGERFSERYASYRVAIQGLTMLYVASLPIFFRYSDLIHSVVALVIYIQLYSLVHEKTAKNYHHIVLMSFFLLLAACVVTPPAEIAVVLLLFLAAAVMTLMELEKTVARQVGPVDAASPPEAPPSTETKREGDPSKRRFRASVPARVLAISGVLITLTATLFVAGPRTEAGLFGGMEDAGAYTTGVSSSVDLSSFGRITSNRAPVMRVQFPDEPEGRYEGELLWRMVAMDEYTGSGWNRREYRRGRGQGRGARRNRFRPARHDDRNSDSWVAQEIYYDKSAKDGVPHLPRARKINSNDARHAESLDINPFGEVIIKSSRINEPGLTYRVESDVTRDSAEDLRSGREDYGGMPGTQFSSLTAQDLLPETEALVAEIIEGADTVYDKVVAVERWLSGGDFSYTLNVPPLPADHPIDTFVHETRSGHCELYASAMALMVRSLGIPARVVSGYRGGEWQESDKSYIVNESMAHLWVEVYFPDFDWVTFDPSPSAPEQPQFALGNFAAAASKFVMTARLIWLQNIVGYNPGNTFGALRDYSSQLFGFSTRSSNTNTSSTTPIEQPADMRFLSHGFVLFAACAVLYFLLRPLVPVRSTSSVPTTDDQQRAVRLYQTISRKLREMGLETEGQTVEELLPQLEANLGIHAPTMADALTAYNAVRFGRRSLPKEALSALSRGVRALRKPLGDGD